MNEIVQLKITLDRTDPPIWRRIQVHQDTSFLELHHIIQIAMGWWNYHMFEFRLREHIIGIPSVEFENWDTVDDARDFSMDLIFGEGEKFLYEYDFGDSWIHLVEVEKFLPKEPDKKYPVCIDGRLACPHEDSGGIDGHYNNMEIIKDKYHPEYRDTKRWLGRNYNPDLFEIGKVNNQLRRLKSYARKWDESWK